MKIWFYSLVFVVSSLAVSSQTCPSDHFSAIFTATVDHTLTEDDLYGVYRDPELYFFTHVLNFRYRDIGHVAEDAFYFFNKTYGLDFHTGTPNDQRELFLQNTKLTPFIVSKDIDILITSNNWIRTGSTRSTCYKVSAGGVGVVVLDDQVLYGTYGGVAGKPAGFGTLLAYGLLRIDVCQQSPVIIQFQTSTPIRLEPVDGTGIINLDVYSRVLGYGKAQGIFTFAPDPYEPSYYRAHLRTAFTFQD